MTARISRAEALTALGGAVSLAALAGAPAAADTPVLHVSIVPIFDVAPLFAAVDQGYFAAENIAVSTEAILGGAVGIPGLLQGSIDVLYSNAVSVFTALDKGLDLRIIMEGSPMNERPPDPGAVLARHGEPIKTGKDLEGKTVAVNQRGSIQWLTVREWVKVTGGNPDKVEFREVPLTSTLDAMRNKLVDAAYVTEPFLTIAMGDPATFQLVDWASDKVDRNGVIALWVITPQTAESKLPQIRAFVRAYRRGVVWVNANRGKDAFVKLLAGYTKLDPALLAKINIPPANATIYPGSFDQLLGYMRENGLLTGNPDVKSKILAV